ncbi:MAG: hypothetical protein ABIO70_24135 [Pseudomonadota bacterium]
MIPSNACSSGPSPLELPASPTSVTSAPATPTNTAKVTTPGVSTLDSLAGSGVGRCVTVVSSNVPAARDAVP